jgi:hypothetical protein
MALRHRRLFESERTAVRASNVQGESALESMARWTAYDGMSGTSNDVGHVLQSDTAWVRLGWDMVQGKWNS